MFLAFNKIIAEYAKTKLSGYHNIDCRTFHSFGSILVSKATGFFADMDQKALGTSKLSAYFDSLPLFDNRLRRRGEFYGKFIARKVVKTIRQLGMMSYELDDITEFLHSTPGIFSIDPRKRAEEETWVYANVTRFPGWLTELDKLPIRPLKDKDGKKINTYETVIDFDDMVRLPCIFKLAERFFTGKDTVLVDESQDMNAYQSHLVTQLCKRGGTDYLLRRPPPGYLCLSRSVYGLDGSHEGNSSCPRITTLRDLSVASSDCGLCQ
jgi:hypothetical protein